MAHSLQKRSFLMPLGVEMCRTLHTTRLEHCTHGPGATHLRKLEADRPWKAQGSSCTGMPDLGLGIPEVRVCTGRAPNFSETGGGQQLV